MTGLDRNDALLSVFVSIKGAQPAHTGSPENFERSAVGKFSAPASEDKPHPVAIDFDNGRRVDPNHKVAVHSHPPFVRGEGWHAIISLGKRLTDGFCFVFDRAHFVESVQSFSAERKVAA